MCRLCFKENFVPERKEKPWTRDLSPFWSLCDSCKKEGHFAEFFYYSPWNDSQMIVSLKSCYQEAGKWFMRRSMGMSISNDDEPEELVIGVDIFLTLEEARLAAISYLEKKCQKLQQQIRLLTEEK
jgi:hypothetical protein